MWWRLIVPEPRGVHHALPHRLAHDADERGAVPPTGPMVAPERGDRGRPRDRRDGAGHAERAVPVPCARGQPPAVACAVRRPAVPPSRSARSLRWSSSGTAWAPALRARSRRGSARPGVRGEARGPSGARPSGQGLPRHRREVARGIDGRCSGRSTSSRTRSATKSSSTRSSIRLAFAVASTRSRRSAGGRRRPWASRCDVIDRAIRAARSRGPISFSGWPSPGAGIEDRRSRSRRTDPRCGHRRPRDDPAVAGVLPIASPSSSTTAAPSSSARPGRPSRPAVRGLRSARSRRRRGHGRRSRRRPVSGPAFEISMTTRGSAPRWRRRFLPRRTSLDKLQLMERAPRPDEPGRSTPACPRGRCRPGIGAGCR